MLASLNKDLNSSMDHDSEYQHTNMWNTAAITKLSLKGVKINKSHTKLNYNYNAQQTSFDDL